MAEAMTDATKRKEPETEAGPESPAAPAPDAASTAPAAAAAVAAAGKPVAAADEPVAKKQKVAAAPGKPDTVVVRKQIEYYLCDENLKYDKFFHDKISEDKEGWLDVTCILSCPKVKAMRATKEDLAAALKDSTLELKEDNSAVRRPGNAALPKLEVKPQHHKKNSIHAHDGGMLLVVSGIPEEQSWKQVKEALHKKLPEKVQIWFVSEVQEDKNQCHVAISPFNGDLEFFQAVELEVGGAKLKVDIAYGDVLQKVAKTLPKHIRDKRDKECRKRQKERNRPIVVGSQKFVNVAALRGRVKEILNSRTDGELLKPEGTDFKLIRALLDYHPKGAEKSAGLVGLKVAKSQLSGSRCFYMTREGKEDEDFSAKKCMDAVELNPPYAKAEPREQPAAAAPTVGDTSAAAPAVSAAPAAASEAAAAAPAAEPAAAQPAAAEKITEVAVPAVAPAA